MNNNSFIRILDLIEVVSVDKFMIAVITIKSMKLIIIISKKINMKMII